MPTDSPSHHARTQRHFLLRQLQAWPRLLACILFAVIVFFLLPSILTLQTATRMLVIWNSGVCLYLLLTGIMIMQSSHEHIHPHAREQEEGRLTVMVSIILATIACLAAIFIDLASVGALRGTMKYAHIAL